MSKAQHGGIVQHIVIYTVRSYMYYLLVLLGELLALFDHALDLLRGQATLVCCDGDLLLLAYIQVYE